MVFNTFLITFFLSTALLPSFSDAHYYLSHPQPRVNRVVFNAPACENGNTDIPQGNNFKTGDWFVPRHGKTNHNGGFALYSLVSLQAKPPIPEVLKEDNIFHMECKNLNCLEPDFNQGGSFIADQDAQKNSCFGSGFNWPNRTGKFTLFVYFYGGHGSDGVEYKQLPNYSNCANIQLTAGNPQSGNGTIPKCTFGGGDGSKLWNGQKPTNQQCAFKRFNNPPLSAKPVNDAIAQDANGDKSQATLTKGVKIGVPDMVTNGGCAIIEKPMKILNGPWKGNGNKMPPPPPGGYKYIFNKQ